MNNVVLDSLSTTFYKNSWRWPVDGGEISCTVNSIVINDRIRQSRFGAQMNTVMIDNFVSLTVDGFISWWRFYHVMSLSIYFSSRPSQGSSYISTPKELLRKQAVSNIQIFDDNYCILYAILAHIHPVGRNDHPELLQNYWCYLYIKIAGAVNQWWLPGILRNVAVIIRNWS